MTKKKCFLSHCSDDAKGKGSFVYIFSGIINKYFGEYIELFNTAEDGIVATKRLGEGLYEKIEKAEIMLCLFTEAYARSLICLTEYATQSYDSFKNSNKKTLTMVFTDNVYEILEVAFVDTPIVVDARTDKNGAAKNFINTFSEALGCKLGEKEKSSCENELTKCFESYKRPDGIRPYISSKAEYENINDYCISNGIEKISEAGHKLETIQEKLQEMKEIFFYATTGDALIETLSKVFIPESLAKGIDFYVIIPQRGSDFIGDLAFVENPKLAQENQARLIREFDRVTEKLQYCIKLAKHRTNEEKIGNIFLCNAYTGLRNTVTLGIDENNNSCWGWVTVTLPPTLSVGKAPTITFSGEYLPEAEKYSPLANIVYNHVRRAVEVAKQKRNGIINLNNEIKDNILMEFDFEKTPGAKEYWEERMEIATANMLSWEGQMSALIEIAAQHPLLHGGKVGMEFKERLDFGIKIYNLLKAEGKDVKIFIPGSIHLIEEKDERVPEPCSLSQAGIKYLINKGIPKEDLYGEECIDEYMGDDGCYNSCDESFIASNLMMTGKFGELHCICSYGQVMRKQLFYANYGVIPQFHTINTYGGFHDFADEIVNKVPQIIYEKELRNWSDPKSVRFTQSRRNRKPNYRENAQFELKNRHKTNKKET